MAKYEIKIQTTGGQESANEIKKVSDHLDRLKKNAEDVAKKLAEMDRAEQAALKTQRVFGDESQQMADHLSKLTKETKSAGIETEKTTSKKSQLLAGLKKLGLEIPIVGYALAALKNPFTAIGVAALLAKKAVDDYVASVELLAETVRSSEGHLGRLEKFFAVIGESKAGLKDFAADLKKILGEAESPKTALDRTISGIRDKFKAQEAFAKEMGADSPGLAAGRKADEAREIADATSNAAASAISNVKTSAGRVPDAAVRLATDQAALETLSRRSSAQDQDDSAEETQLLEKARKLQDNINGLGGGFLGRTLTGLGFQPGRKFFESPGDSRARQESELADVQNRLSGISVARGLREADLGKASRRVDASGRELSGFQDEARTGVSTARDLINSAPAGDSRAAAQAADLIRLLDGIGKAVERGNALLNRLNSRDQNSTPGG